MKSSLCQYLLSIKPKVVEMLRILLDISSREALRWGLEIKRLRGMFQRFELVGCPFCFQSACLPLVLQLSQLFFGRELEEHVQRMT